MLMESRTGMAGLAIILAFAFMAIFAPFIAPYSVDFIAPADDMFSVDRIVLQYPVKDGYYSMVVGPTTPSESSMGGGIWFILANQDGTIEMDFGIKTALDPFEEGNMSISLDIADYGLELPLSEVLYLTPARGYNSTSTETSTFGERVESGLLTFVANTTFVIFDPFTETVLHQEDAGFIPKWVVQDTTSAGNMLNPPSQRKITENLWFTRLEGPFRYVTLANESKFVTYKFEYCWNIRGIGPVQNLVEMDIPITQKPLNYKFDNVKYAANTTGIYIPSTNGTLYYFNGTTNGTAAKIIQFNISSEPVEFTGPMGYHRTMDTTPKLYIPTAVDYAYSVKIYDLNADALLGEFQGNGGLVKIAPSPTTSDSIYIAVHGYADGIPTNTTVFKSSGSGVLDSSFLGEMDTVARSIFVVEQASLLYAIDTNGVVHVGQTIITVTTPYVNRGMKELFYTGSPDSQLEYFGSFGGTKYSTTMTSEEMRNLFFNPETCTMDIFQSIGTSLGALPPGTYASGNRYILGTDNVGHDILTHLIYGSRVALFVGLTAAFFSVVVGTLIGLISGYYGGRIDMILMRITDIALTIPFLPIVLIWTQISGQSIWNIVIILALLGWPGITRVVRAQTLSLKERSFVDAARVSGSSDTKIILKHIAPNVLPFSFLYMTLFVAGAILTEAALSYLALGDPKVISWGNMLSTIQTSGHSLIAPWWMLPPGLAITILSLGFYLLGRGMDEIINPRLRRR
ncbi:MAG: ABC transporter permease [Candidatus Thermoplasmatota archaeon]|nr:ABC transporter permease [Euryarchaeota archaeon]MBU4032843.1 ABC transporter permease [Candidatus Thermoplasmatota archaeon]MBU4145241.1 ABC transporter permease [Candidatus Thermoplasmatota archaeon]MBU4591208.1 ABC transporter permease [Candidatus Thermoplasmatota archaeon]